MLSELSHEEAEYVRVVSVPLALKVKALEKMLERELTDAEIDALIDEALERRKRR